MYWILIYNRAKAHSFVIEYVVGVGPTGLGSRANHHLAGVEVAPPVMAPADPLLYHRVLAATRLVEQATVGHLLALLGRRRAIGASGP